MSPRCGSPPSGCSTFSTSAPHSARTAPAAGTNVQAATSRTLTPARTSCTWSSRSVGGSELGGDGSLDLHELHQVAAHDLRDVGLGQALEVVDEGDGVGHALGVRPVGAERAAVGAHDL